MCAEERARPVASRGFTLVELILVVVIFGVGVVGAVTAINQAVLRAGEPIVRKQALALAEAVLDEVIQRPFLQNPLTPAVDPTLDSSVTDTDAASRTQPHEVDDYHGMDMAVVRTIDGIVVPALAGYRVRVTVVDTAFGAGAAPVVPAGAAKLISVRVTGPAGTDITIQGFRVNGLG